MYVDLAAERVLHLPLKLLQVIGPRASTMPSQWRTVTRRKPATPARRWRGSTWAASPGWISSWVPRPPPAR